MDLATGILNLTLLIVDGVVNLIKSISLGPFNLFDFCLVIIIVSLFISVLVRSAKA